MKKKKIECSRSGCGYGVKKEGDFCKKHQEPITTPVKEQKQGLDNQAGAGAVQAEPAQGEALEPKSIAEFDENREETTDAATSTEAATQGSEEIDPAVSAATGDDAAEQVISRPVGLSALLRTPPPSGRAADPVFRGRALHPRRIGSHRGAHSRTRTHGAVRRPAAGGGGIAP